MSAWYIIYYVTPPARIIDSQVLLLNYYNKRGD